MLFGQREVQRSHDSKRLADGIVGKERPILPQPSEHNHTRQASTGGNVSASILKERHTFAGKDMASDPLLTQLYNARRDPCVMGSVLQAIPGTTFVDTLDRVENAKLKAINIGDVVQYRDPGSQDTVMAAVIGITGKRARGNGIAVRIQARRLYSYKELFEILDSIAPYRLNPKLRDVSFSANSAP